ncbi:MAG: hypothetical protein K9J13_02600 [Saprospiraceae bacterium]|nr:hypothetical protein [Saprospiraceae bacterium]
MEKQLIYSSKNRTYNLFGIWLLRIALLIMLVTVLYNIMENPNGLSILAGIILIVIFIVKSEKLELYNNRIILKKRFFLDIFSINKVYYYKDILEFHVSGNRTLKNDLIEDILSPQAFEFRNYISIKLKDKGYKKHVTYIYLDELEKIRKKLNELKKHIK